MPHWKIWKALIQTTVSLYLLYFLILIPPFLFISKAICMKEASLFLQDSFPFSHLGYHSASLKTMAILLVDFRKVGLVVRNDACLQIPLKSAARYQPSESFWIRIPEVQLPLCNLMICHCRNADYFIRDYDFMQRVNSKRQE